MAINNVGFLGCGKIGSAMIEHMQKKNTGKITFVQTSSKREANADYAFIDSCDVELLKATDLVVECATPDALKENAREILKYASMLVFSITAFIDEDFCKDVSKICAENNTKIFLPHGAIVGIDGISGARELLTAVSIETIKSPQSLGRTDTERTVVYEGVTREACRAYPRNVNVHAMVALAGLGLDNTISRIISDPAVNTNTHNITAEGDGIHFHLAISSFSTGGVTGNYTPYSACGSLDRVLGGNSIYVFV